HWDAAAAAGPAARALRAGGSAIDRVRALTCLTQAIYYEAASEPDAGQRAVAQVVLNRVAHPAYPKTVCGVVYQGAERTTGCQFTFTCDGALARLPNRLFWLRAETVARAALAGAVYAPVGLATHYHTIAVHPAWADSLAFVGTIGAHRFYRFGGPAGAPATFNVAAYRGGEPVAAPPPRAPGAAAPDAALDPLAIERAFAQGYSAAQAGLPGPGPLTPSPMIPGAAAPGAARAAPGHAAPRYAPALQARGGDTLYTAQTLPESQGIRPEYAQSGQWIARPGT
ncbi:cell wall hydrolase, partial [Novosphingobium piscinae]